MPRKNFGQRIHEYLAEPPGEQFVAGKWRFWLVAVVFLSVLNAVLTALIFKNDDQENYISAIMLSVGALLAWLCVGCLHYSDSTDRRLARGVAGLDSVTLLFVVAHFCGLLWCYGHLRTIQNAERKYDLAAAAYNSKNEKISQDNTKIAEAQARIEIERTKRAKIENDTVYQARKAAQAGARVQTGSSHQGAASLSTAPIELERPVKPETTSAQFLGRWDWLIRVMNFGELLLAAMTLVFIRNQSAKTNEPGRISSPTGDFFPTAVYRSPLSTPAFDGAKNDHTVWLENDHTDAEKKATRVASETNEEGLKKLRAVLSEIAFQYGPTHFFSDAKWDRGYVWIRQRKSENGVARTIASCRARISILDDAASMSREAFRTRLERFLGQNGFEL
jgi:hypothetical protein